MMVLKNEKFQILCDNIKKKKKSQLKVEHLYFLFAIISQYSFQYIEKSEQNKLYTDTYIDNKC